MAGAGQIVHPAVPLPRRPGSIAAPGTPAGMYNKSLCRHPSGPHSRSAAAMRRSCFEKTPEVLFPAPSEPVVFFVCAMSKGRTEALPPYKSASYLSDFSHIGSPIFLLEHFCQKESPRKETITRFLSRVRPRCGWWRRWESNPCPKGVQCRCLRVQAIYNIPAASRRSSG